MRNLGRLSLWLVLVMGLVLAALLLVQAQGSSSTQYKAAAKKWVDTEFQPSTLSKTQQMKEME